MPQKLDVCGWVGSMWQSEQIDPTKTSLVPYKAYKILKGLNE